MQNPESIAEELDEWCRIAQRRADKLATHREWAAKAVDCINRGIDIMTDEQVAQWEGVRGILEMKP